MFRRDEPVGYRTHQVLINPEELRRLAHGQHHPGHLVEFGTDSFDQLLNVHYRLSSDDSRSSKMPATSPDGAVRSRCRRSLTFPLRIASRKCWPRSYKSVEERRSRYIRVDSGGLYFAGLLGHNQGAVHLTPREIDKLLIFSAGELARKRL